jgi:putative hydrolase of the HAD superfamily
MRFTTILFDLDDTLYPSSCGLWPAIKERMNSYMAERMGIPSNQIPRLREKYFREYGTTLRGLQAFHQVDVQDYLAYVHDLPLKEYLHPDPVQQKVLASLPTRNLIFTNADVPHARRVLRQLQIEQYFADIVDVNCMAPYCKPSPEAFKIALNIAGESDPPKCVMIDDLPHTTRAARDFGLYALLYGRPMDASFANLDADAVFDDWPQLSFLVNGS